MNFIIEVYSTLMCVVGIVCLRIMLPRGANRRFMLQVYLCCILMCLGDAAAAMGRGQPGALALAAVHGGNFLAFVAPQCSLAFYAVYLSRLFGTPENRLAWWGRVAWGVVAIAAACVVLGGAYSIDADNVYSRGPGFWVMGVTAFVLAAVNLIVLLRHRAGLSRRTFIVFLLFSVLPMGASVVQVLAYGLNVAAIAHLLCLLALFADATVSAAEDAAAARERAALKDKELAEARLATVASQIHPHFLFNTLDGIYYLVAEDPARAQQAIDEFSSYLRANLESLERSAVIPIEKELAHVRTYLGLEKMSMEDLLEYDIDMRVGEFCVPTLSVQTLVENAVKHGLSKKPDGGRVTVRTSEVRDRFLVVVQDDGVGFDPAHASGDGHIGLKNTRNRLEAMRGGELVVDSTPGGGTTATMWIPKENTERLEREDHSA